MAKIKIEEQLEEIGDQLKSRQFRIVKADLSDGFCNYSYEITDGIGLGDVHGVKGAGLVKDDFLKSYNALNVHLAAIDDAFKNAGMDVKSIDKVKNDPLAMLYVVSGFQIKGGDEDESIIITGNKYLGSAGGRMELKSPKIPLDHGSSYAWAKELKLAANIARLEVALYREGKYEPVEEEEKEPAAEQGNLFKGSKKEKGSKEDDDEFDKARED